MPSDPAQQAAAGVMGDFIETQEQLDALLPDPNTVAPMIPAEAPEAAVAEGEQPQDDVEIPEINWEIPDELKEELEAPDFDDEDDEPVFQPAAEQEEDGYDDPEKAQLRKQLAKAQKKLAWENEQRVKASRKNWAEEARRYFQFSNPDIIEASSRRAFLKEAQRQHDAVAKVAKPVFDQLAELKAKVKEEALAEARVEADQRWGAPTTGPSAAATLETTQSVQRERMAQGKSFTDHIRGRIKKGDLKL
jgi:murein L,D-transpeptidase YcbB/YkuD